MADVAEHLDGTNESIEDIEFLTRSHSRVRILDMLRAADHLEKHAITDRLGVSRTTVKRNLDSLVERGWVSERGGTYAITGPGTLIADDFDALVGSIRTAKRLAPVTKWAPETAFGFDLRELADARITLSEPNDPYAPLDRHVDTIETADSVRALLPAIARPAIEALYDRLSADGATGELVLGRAVASTVESNARYARLCEGLLETGRMSIVVSDGTVPYYLGLVDDTVQIGVEDDDGMQRALVESTAPAVHRWATDTYEEYWNAATPLF